MDKKELLARAPKETLNPRCPGGPAVTTLLWHIDIKLIRRAFGEMSSYIPSFSSWFLNVGEQKDDLIFPDSIIGDLISESRTGWRYLCV